MRINILFRNFLAYALIIIFTTAIITIIAHREFKKSYIDNLESSLENQAQIISTEIADQLKAGDYLEIDRTVDLIGQKTKIRITVISSNGKVIAESDYNQKEMEDHSSRPEFIQAVKSGRGRIIRYSETTQKEMLYIAVPISTNDKKIGVVRTSSYFTDIATGINAVNKKIFYSAIILTVLALILAIITSRGLTRPIRSITRAAERIKNGDFSARIITRRKDEIGRLAESVNLMAESLNKYFTSLNAEQEETRSIISSMAEGLVVLDDKDRIVMTNDNFNLISGNETKSLKDKYFWEAIKSSELSELVNEAKNNNQKPNTEITINNRIYSANAAMVKPGKATKIVVVLHDITETKNLEKVKADFIANVSHELKTPLTSIKGFAETIADEGGKKYRGFAETIRRNADRLINVVQDLLVISELERKEETLQIESIDIKEIINSLKKIFANRIKEKKLKLKINIADNAQFMRADYFLIEQALSNLVDNAIKYNTDKGTININVSKSDNNTKIVVEDTGIGISHEHQDRIFERFYVVDKSRSRKLGGTGLGLAIVKHIVLSHNGEIKVESEAGKGTRFIILIPQ